MNSCVSSNPLYVGFDPTKQAIYGWRASGRTQRLSSLRRTCKAYAMNQEHPIHSNLPSAAPTRRRAMSGTTLIPEGRIDELHESDYAPLRCGVNGPGGPFLHAGSPNDGTGSAARDLKPRLHGQLAVCLCLDPPHLPFRMGVNQNCSLT
jgi:hypothetical protein